MSICPEECPSTMGGSCACVYNCPECGWVTECYPNCPISSTLREFVQQGYTITEWEVKE
jgi:hypothetical protein